MNHITINGKDSRKINGLLICSLPAITKPPIRTEIEEIDGRDGDIVTQLGYSAYDKTFEIGLFGDYDVDQIIGFFSGPGIVTFSNERDKFYRFQIIDRIDFERLIRFKTATVTMHVQPFKYSLVDRLKTYSLDDQFLSFRYRSVYERGIHVSMRDDLGGRIFVYGNSTATTEFFLPIPTLTVTRGNYAFKAYSSGTRPDCCTVRLIHNSTSEVNTFGGGALTLVNGETVRVDAPISNTKTYNYIHLCVLGGVTMNFSIDVKFSYGYPLEVRNNGNTTSKPAFTVYGVGTVGLSLNGASIFMLDIGNEGSITIDTELMEAFNDDGLKNRLVTGNYEDFSLKPGKNEIVMTGDVEKFEIKNYTRWL